MAKETIKLTTSESAYLYRGTPLNVSLDHNKFIFTTAQYWFFDVSK